MTLKSMLRGSALITALMLMDTGLAHAQAVPGDQVARPDDTSDQIVVTGSRIRQDPLNQDSPVVTVDQSAIARTGLSSIADVLQQLPSASGGLNSKVNNSGNIGNPPDGGGVGAGAAEIELRYLVPSARSCSSMDFAISPAPRPAGFRRRSISTPFRRA